MKILYFSDTDTVLVELTDKKVVETRDFNENVILDFDEDGNVVSITLEHAKESANISDFSFRQISNQPATT